MWAKVFAALAVSAAVTAVGLYYAAPGAVAELALSDGTPAVAAGDESPCCAKRKAAACPSGADAPACSLTEPASASSLQSVNSADAANIGTRVCPTDAFAAFGGTMPLAASRGKTGNFNCCAE